MPNIIETEMTVTDIKDTTTSIKSEKEEKIKDHEQVHTITATNGKTLPEIHRCYRVLHSTR